MSNANDVIELNNDTFDSFVSKSNLPVVVDFYADWCGPCKIMHPIMSAVSEKMKKKVQFAKVNVDEANNVANKYKVQGIPLFLIIKGGKVVDSKVGAMHEQAMVDFIEKNI